MQRIWTDPDGSESSCQRIINFERVNNFHKKLSKSYDALQTLEKSDILDKLPHVKLDLVRTD